MGFVVANAMALATAEVRHAAGTGSAVLGFLQYALGAGAMFAAAVLAALALVVLTRGRRSEAAGTIEPAEPSVTAAAH